MAIVNTLLKGRLLLINLAIHYDTTVFLGHKMLKSCICVVMVTIINMVDMATSTPVESLELHGNSQLGYYVRLGLGSPYQVVSVFVIVIISKY